MGQETSTRSAPPPPRPVVVGPSTLAPLTSDVLQELMSYFTISRRVATLRTVCKTWHEAHRAALGWEPEVRIGVTKKLNFYGVFEATDTQSKAKEIPLSMWTEQVLPYCRTNRRIVCDHIPLDQPTMDRLLAIERLEEFTVNFNPSSQIPRTIMEDVTGQWGDTLTSIRISTPVWYDQLECENRNLETLRWRPAMMERIARCRHLRKLHLEMEVDLMYWDAKAATTDAGYRLLSGDSRRYSGMCHLREIAPQLVEFRFRVGGQLHVKDAAVVSLMRSLEVLDLHVAQTCAVKCMPCFCDLRFLRPLAASETCHLKELNLGHHLILHRRSLTALQDISQFVELEVLNLDDCAWVSHVGPLMKLTKLKHASFGYHLANVELLQEKYGTVVDSACYGVYGEECYQDSDLMLGSSDDEGTEDDADLHESYDHFEDD